MKSSRMKRKVSRMMLSACALAFASGIFVSCEDKLEVLTGTPDWLNASIYETLQKGNICKEGETYHTFLRLIDDPDISPVNAENGETENHNLLIKTGSKTLFVADDDAFERFFDNNQWGVKCYDSLSVSQKKLLFNTAMLNSAYLIELMSNAPIASGSNKFEPDRGVTMRRASSVNWNDSIMKLTSASMPNNKYWDFYKEKFKDGTDTMLILTDGTVTPMVHFLPAYNRVNFFTDNDINILSGGAATQAEQSVINGKVVKKADITCQNGYIQVMADVMEPLSNMAHAIRKHPNLIWFNSFLERFAVPVQNRVENGDTIYEWRYFNSGNSGATGSYRPYLDTEGDKSIAKNVLPFDPGWNRYVSTGSEMAADYGVIIAPTDDAIVEYFYNGAGKMILDESDGKIENISDNIIAQLLENLMKTSIKTTVPSKFEKVTNTQGYPMYIEPEDLVLDSVLQCSNGIVYLTKKMYVIPEYQSVSFPATLDTANIKIMDWIIDELDYTAYLESMESDYTFVLPTDEALKNYLDPVEMMRDNGAKPRITEFIYNKTGSPRVAIKLYEATLDETTGQYVKGKEVSNTNNLYSSASDMNDYVRNRLLDILEGSVIVGNVEDTPEQRVYTTINGNVITFDNLKDNNKYNVKIVTTGALEQDKENPSVLQVRNAGDPDGRGYYFFGRSEDKSGNGITYIVDKAPVTSATKSVNTILKEKISELAPGVEADEALETPYSEFYQIMARCGVLSENYNREKNSSGNYYYKDVSNGLTFNCIGNFHYTLYVPESEELKKLYGDFIPDWRTLEDKEDQITANEDVIKDLEDQIKGMTQSERGPLEDQIEALEMENVRLSSYVAKADSLLMGFVRYHIQLRSVYQYGKAEENSEYETMRLERGRFATVMINNDGNGNISVQPCQDHSPVFEPRQTSSNENTFAREVILERGGSGTATTNLTLKGARKIQSSAFVTMHLINGPLVTQFMKDEYEALQNQFEN